MGDRKGGSWRPGDEGSAREEYYTWKDFVVLILGATVVFGLPFGVEALLGSTLAVLTLILLCVGATLALAFRRVRWVRVPTEE